MATAVHVKDVGIQDFDQSVIDESFRRPVVVDFWAPWCGPCRILGPVLERLAEEFKGDFLLAKVNTEENPEIAQGFGIRSIPNVKVFKGGAVVDEFMGAISEGEARHFLRRHCPSDADRKYAEGLACLDLGQAQERRERQGGLTIGLGAVCSRLLPCSRWRLSRSSGRVSVCSDAQQELQGGGGQKSDAHRVRSCRRAQRSCGRISKAPGNGPLLIDD